MQTLNYMCVLNIKSVLRRRHICYLPLSAYFEKILFDRLSERVNIVFDFISDGRLFHVLAGDRTSIFVTMSERVRTKEQILQSVCF